MLLEQDADDGDGRANRDRRKMMSFFLAILAEIL
jgi:hypothetical protein